MAWIVLGVMVGLIVALIKTRYKPSALFAATLFLFFAMGQIEAKSMIDNFVNPSLLILAILIIVTAPIERSTYLQSLSHSIFTTSSYALSLSKMSVFTALVSALLNNTAVVATMMGVIKSNKKITPSKYLLPLSYVAILGGTMTLIGTSTNLIVNGLAISEGLEGFGLFDFIYVGLPLTLAGFLVVLLNSRNLPDHSEAKTVHRSNYFVEALVGTASPLIGKSIEHNRFRHLENLFLVEIIRHNKLISPVSPKEIVEADDILVFAGNISNLHDLKRFEGLEIFNSDSSVLESNIVEVVVSHESVLIGSCIREANFRSKFDAAVIAVRRGSERLSGKIGDITIQSGDTLVLATGDDFSKRDNIDRNFYVVQGVTLERKLSNSTSNLVILGFIAILLLNALNVLPLLDGLIYYLGALIGFKILSFREIRRRIPFDILLLVGSALGISQVMNSSGAAHLVVDAISALFSDFGIYGQFISVYIISMILTELITNNAAAAIAFPIAYSTAIELHVDPTPFILAIAYGASASFMTPYGYQTNLMVYGPGQYRFSDYLRNGAPLSIVYGVIVISLVPIFFPF
ncbi:MAG: SLC13 family permease [Campylobacterales bacterium]|nr:SLC13 family permease [Campylobacterales bacterium]